MEVLFGPVIVFPMIVNEHVCVIVCVSGRKHVCELDKLSQIIGYLFRKKRVDWVIVSVRWFDVGLAVLDTRLDSKIGDFNMQWACRGKNKLMEE